MLMAIFCAICIVVTIILKVQSPDEHDILNIEKEYYSLREKVDFIKTLDYSDRTIFYPDLIKEVENMNSLIEKHKFNCDSKWDGMMYSEKIGKLDPINLW